MQATIGGVQAVKQEWHVFSQDDVRPYQELRLVHRHEVEWSTEHPDPRGHGITYHLVPIHTFHEGPREVREFVYEGKVRIARSHVCEHIELVVDDLVVNGWGSYIILVPEKP